MVAKEYMIPFMVAGGIMMGFSTGLVLAMELPENNIIRSGELIFPIYALGGGIILFSTVIYLAYGGNNNSE